MEFKKNRGNGQTGLLLFGQKLLLQCLWDLTPPDLLQDLSRIDGEVFFLIEVAIDVGDDLQDIFIPIPANQFGNDFHKGPGDLEVLLSILNLVELLEKGAAVLKEFVRQAFKLELPLGGLRKLFKGDELVFIVVFKYGLSSLNFPQIESGGDLSGEF